MSALKKAGQAALRRLDRGLEVAEHVLASYDEAVKWRREAQRAKEDAEGWRQRAMVLSRRQKEWAAGRAEAVAMLGRWKERVEPAEARAAELAAEVGALRERLLGALGRADNWAGKTLDELIEEVGNLVDQHDELQARHVASESRAGAFAADVSALRKRLAEEQERRGRAESAMGVVVERLCGGAPRSLEEVLAAVQALEVRADQVRGDVAEALGLNRPVPIDIILRHISRLMADFRIGAMAQVKAQRDSALRDLKNAETALRVAVVEAVAADRAAVAEWLVGLKLQHAEDAGRALRGDLEWLPPPPLPPVNSSKISNGSPDVAGRVAAEALTESIEAMGPHLHEGEALPDGIRRLVGQQEQVARWAHDVFGKAAE